MSAQNRVLEVDDGAPRSTVAAALESKGGFAVTHTNSVAEAMAETETRASRFDAIILDLARPDADACALCARMRYEGHMPIIRLGCPTVNCWRWNDQPTSGLQRAC